MLKAILSKEDSDIVLKEMFKRVGAEDKYDTFDFKKKNWFWDYTWTLEEEQDFIKWVGKFLKEKRYVGKGKKRGMDWGVYEAIKIVGNYGWRTKQKT